MNRRTFVNSLAGTAAAMSAQSYSRILGARTIAFAWRNWAAEIEAGHVHMVQLASKYAGRNGGGLRSLEHSPGPSRRPGCRRSSERSPKNTAL